ncbi:MAG: EAL domain-containing protein [Chromatiales bacterium]|jgi:EAL domain-containing protein (putative c-di-GMP-specific phosphodiesterase class I)
MSLGFEDLKRGLAGGELVLHYQPKIDFLTGRIGGAEALVRWNHPERGLLPPEDFMPVAELRSFVPAITGNLFPQLVADFQAIKRSGSSTTIAFNISAQDLDRPGLLQMINEQVRLGTFHPAELEIEITECGRVSDNATSHRNIAGLLAAGIGLAMDDYGSGFSSLETLNRLPFSAIKLDQSFAFEMLSSGKSATLVKTSIAAAQMLGIKTVVEGIESESIYRSLLHSGCTQGQGFWISPPLSLSDYLRFLDEDRCWPRSPVGMLRMAQITHTWQYKLLMDLVCSAFQRDAADEACLEQMHIDHHKCALGAWYYGAGQEFRGDPDFDALHDPHRAMHNTCERIIEAMRGARKGEQMRSLLMDLSGDSIRVAGCLERLETRLLMEEIGEGPGEDGRAVSLTH